MLISVSQKSVEFLRGGMLRVIDMSCNEYIEMVTCVSNVKYKLSETSVRRQAVHTEFDVIEPHTNSQSKHDSFEVV